MAGTLTGEAVSGLLRTIQRRLWGVSIGRFAHWGIWWAGASALGLGAIHRWVLSVPLAVALTVTLVPFAAFIAWSVARGRPGLEQCARTADSLFQGKELMISAYGLMRSGHGREAPSATNDSRRAPSSPAEVVAPRRYSATTAATLVLSRAATAAASWHAHLPALARPRGIVTPIGLACAGAFLLANAGAPHAPTVWPQPESAAGANAANELNLGDAQPMDPELAPGEVRARLMAQGDAPGLPEDPDAREPTPLLIPDMSRPGINVPTQRGAGKLASTARAMTPPGETTELPEIQVRLITVEAVESASQRLAGLGGMEPDAGADPSATLSGGPTALGIMPDPDRLLPFSPAQRRYVAAYFQAQREPEEETP